MKLLCSSAIVLILVAATSAWDIYALSGRHVNRIVGGDDTTIEEIPYQVSIIYQNPWCGGAILSSNVILTAAHCVKGKNKKDLQVLAGTTNLCDGFLRNVSKVYVHEEYNPSTIDYDIALVVLDRPLEFSLRIQPIPLPDECDVLGEGDLVVISGWGDTQATSFPYSLQKVVVPVLNQDMCASWYQSRGRITPRMLCAGDEHGGKDHCNGDSGGPVVSKGKIHGIVSWAYKCALPKYPGVSTRVTAVRQWIRAKVNL